jgi:GT2 family glycosyltransferase
MNSKKKISIIIANWNGKNHLTKCLKSLEEQTYGDFEVIVVDNGSQDGSTELIKREFKFVKLIEKKANFGFAKANNIGISKSAGEYIITLNNDIYADKKFIEALKTAADSSNSDIGMWAPKILSMEKPDEIDSIGGLLLYPDGIGKGRGRGEIDKGQYDHIQNILIPSACAAMYRRKMLLETGLFDEHFFAYCEDTDLGLRGRKIGWAAISVPSAIVHHHYSGTTGKYSVQKAYLVERNRQWVVLKNFPFPLIAKSPAFTIWRVIIQVYGMLICSGAGYSIMSEGGSKREVFMKLLSSYKDAFSLFPEMYRARKEILKKQRISDYEFLRVIEENRIRASELILKG